MLAIRSALAWLAILVVAMLNGAFREAVLLPNMRLPEAYLVSGVLLASFTLVIAVSLARWMGLDSVGRAAAVGIMWLAWTLCFEFGFGLFQGHTWPEMLEAYTFKDGNIWPLVLSVVLVAPVIGWRARR